MKLSIWTILPCIISLACTDSSPDRIPDRAPSEADLDALCAERVSSGTESAALSAQARVDTIADRLAAREAELGRLEQAINNDAKRAAASKAERERLKGEVDTLQQELGSAEQARDTARSQLVVTLKTLDAKIAETQAARADARRQRTRAEQGEWAAFLARSQNTICDRGSRKRHVRCHEAVETALSGPLKARFDRCTQSEQAVPELRQLDKEDALPAFAETIPDDRSFTRKGWAIVFCDPNLPEPG
jgi:chromosome segregation ATPase